MNIRAAIQRHPLIAYFGTVFFIAWAGFLVAVGPGLFMGGTIQPAAALALFPVMVFSVSATGIALTGITAGAAGIGELFSRIGRWRVGPGWYAAVLLIPLCTLLFVLILLSNAVSRDFAPNNFIPGFVFGLIAGGFEEVGWMGFAFPRMLPRYSPLKAALVLGILWALWHIAVVDALGAAGPHGAYWGAYFLAFALLILALRVLIVWVYANTGSVLLCQLMHACFTGFLVVFGPSHVSAGQETLWYAVYAIALWIVAAVVIARLGNRLARSSSGR